MNETQSATPPVKVAVVGLGWVASHRHLPVMTRDARFEVVGVVDPRAERAREVAGKFGIKRSAVTDDLAKVPWLDEVEAITISTNPFLHYPLAKAALEAGKHVLTEKPFVMEVAQGRELVELAQERGRILSIVHNFQFADSFLKLQRDLKRGRLGEVTSVQAIQFSNPRRRLPVWYEQLPMGLFWDESPHLLYLLRALFGDSLELRDAFCQRVEGRQTPDLLFAGAVGTRKGKIVPVSLQWNFVASLSEWQFAVFGTRRSAWVDIFRDIYISLPNDGLHTTKTVARTSLCAAAQHFGQHLGRGAKHLRGELFYGNEEVFGRFADAVRSGQAPRAIGARDALATLELQHELIERATRSSSL